MDDGRDNVGEDRGENGHDDGQRDGDSPQAEYICRNETAALDHLNDPDPEESQDQGEIR